MDNKAQIVVEAVDKTRAAFASVGAGLADLERGSGAVAAALGRIPALGAALAGAMSGLSFKAIIDAADNVNDLSQRIGISVKQLAAWQFAAEQSGTSLEAVGKGVKSLSTYMVNNAEALRKAGVSANDANGALIELADMFAGMPDGIEKTALATQLFGKAGLDMIPMLNQGSKGLAEAQEKAKAYGERLAELAPEADRFNDQLAELALNAKLVGVALASQVVGPMGQWIEANTEAMRIAGGFGEMLRLFVFNLDAMTTEKPIEEIRRLTEELEKYQKASALGKFFQSPFGGLEDDHQKKIEFLKFLQRQQVMADAGKLGDYRDARDRRLTDPKIFDPSGLLPKPASASAKNVDELGNLLNKLYSTDLGIDAEYQQQLATLSAGLASGRLNAQQYAEALFMVTKNQNFHKEAVKEDAAEQKRWNDASAAAAQEVERGLQSLEDKARAMEDEVRYYGMTESEIQRTIIARLEEERIKAASTDSQEALVKKLDREIAARKKLAAAAGSKEALDANQRAIDEQQRAWERMHEQLGQSLTDEIMRGGKNAGELLQDYFKTLVLRPIIQGVVSSGMNAVGLGGTSGSAGNLLSAGSSGYSLLSGGSNLYSTFATSSIGETLGLSSMGAGGMGPPALSTLGSALPYVAAALAVASMFAKKSTPHVGGIGFSSGNGYSTPVGRDAISALYANPDQALSLGMMRSDWTKRNDPAMSQQMGVVSQGYAQTFNGILKENGLSSNYTFGLAFSADGEDPARGHATITDAQGNIVGSYQDNNDLGSDPNQALQRYLGTEVPQMMLSALEDMDLNPLADAYLDSLDIEGLSAEASAQALLFVQASDNIIDAFGALGVSADDVSVALIDALGGVDAALAGLGNYYQGYYTEGERINYLRTSLDSQFDALGFADMPTTRAGFRALVESIDLGTSEGQAQYAGLIGLSSAFGMVADFDAGLRDTVTEPIRSAAESMRDSGSDIAAAWQDMADSLLDTARQLRGELLGEDSAGFAWLQAQFATTTAAARAGDLNAADQLPGLAESMIDAGRLMATTTEEYRLLLARTSASLTTTAGVRGKVPAFASGGWHDGGYAVVGENGPELAYMPPAQIYSNSDSRALVDLSPLVAEIRRLDARLATIERAAVSTERAVHGEQRAPVLVENAA